MFSVLLLIMKPFGEKNSCFRTPFTMQFNIFAAQQRLHSEADIYKDTLRQYSSGSSSNSSASGASPIYMQRVVRVHRSCQPQLHRSYAAGRRRTVTYRGTSHRTSGISPYSAYRAQLYGTQAHSTSASAALRYSTMAADGQESELRNKTQQSPLARQRAKENGETEKAGGRFSNLFPLGYRDTFSQWVCLYIGSTMALTD